MKVKRPTRWKKLRDEGRFHSPYFNIASISPLSSISPHTRRWIRNANDERAAQEGFYFSEEHGIYTAEWIEEHCALYEGDRAGTLIRLDDWQYESVMQLFGWQGVSKDIRFQGQVLRRFKIGHIWVPKKNKKSPTSAAIGCYMLIGDGEPGQKVFSAAADGKQAGIAHRHAICMIEQSPELSVCCTIDRGTGEIKYHYKNGTYSVVSGKNTSGQQGLNGTVLIDEVHVVTERLYDTLQYAGISRREAFLLTFSTAGDDLASLGYQLYEKSISIQRGSMYEPSTYVSIFGDISLEKNPDGKPLSPEDWYNEKIVIPLARKANPALGDTISEDELIGSWRAATRSITELNRWKKYRCNVWASGDSGWLDPTDFVKCSTPFTYRDMFEAKAPCSLAVDLSKTGDTTSLTATFSIKKSVPLIGTDGVSTDTMIEKVFPHQITWGWIPEGTAIARKTKSDINFERWQNETDNLTICKGHRTVPYKYIAEFIRWFYDAFDVRGIGYDAWNSAELITDLTQTYGIPTEILYKVPQNMPIMGPFTTLFEKHVLDKTLVFNGSEYLQWQLGNVQLMYDAANNYKPAKPSKGSPRTIDGIISSIMSNGVFHLPELNLTNEPICSVAMLEPARPYA